MKKNVSYYLFIIAFVFVTGYFSIQTDGNRSGNGALAKPKEVASQAVFLNRSDTASNQSVMPVSSPIERQQALSLTLTTKEGKAVSLESFKGEPVLFVTWTTWCAECKKELQILKNMHPKTYKIVLVNLTTSETSASEVIRYVEKYGITLPVLLDPKGEFQRAFHVQVVPTSILLDQNGQVLHLFYGPANQASIEKWLPTTGHP